MKDLDPVKQLDKVLSVLDVYSKGINDIQKELGLELKTENYHLVRMILQKLCKDGFAKKIPNKTGNEFNTNSEYGKNKFPPSYKITFEGKYFIPTGYEGKLKEEKKLRDLKKEQIQSVIDTNESIDNLNEKTGTFYGNQNRYNRTQKYLTIVIFLAAAVSSIVATCGYYYPKNSDIKIYPDTTTHTQQLQELENKLKSHIEKDSVFQKTILDSLKKFSIIK